MIQSDKKLKELKAILSGAESPVLRAAIVSLRDEEPFEGAIGLLAGLYDITEDISVQNAIRDFLNDLKDQSVSAEVIQVIRKPFRQETLSMLVSSCWQSRLDYSEFSDDIINIFLTSDYIVALECLTVIEESAFMLSREKKNEMIRYIGKYTGKFSSEKEDLTKELIYILR
jgi:hypothetical protein